jgi:hypothetical protein
MLIDEISKSTEKLELLRMIDATIWQALWAFMVFFYTTLRQLNNLI